MCLNIKLIKNPIIATLSNHLEFYPTPVNLSYLWGFGSLSGLALVGQIITGILLAMHYTPEVSLAFVSVEHIMRDVMGGVGLRYIHANGASMFFIVVYMHILRGLYYGSYYQPRVILWVSGVIIFFLMMATAFMGYVLPWGQMSFWGATVITNLFSAIPFVGGSIVEWLWGGFSVDNPTLNRFFSLHYLLPFAIIGLVLVHLILLHVNGSNNPLGLHSLIDRISFYPYFYVKDLFGFLLFVAFFSYFVIYSPNALGHPDNYIEADPMVTPAHIVPEWYFLPFYAVLRTIPDKLGGVIMMVFAILVLLLLPVVDFSRFRSSFFKPFHVKAFWVFLGTSLILGWIGQEPVEEPYTSLSIWVTLVYFGYVLILLPSISLLEQVVLEGKQNSVNNLRFLFFFFIPEYIHSDFFIDFEVIKELILLIESLIFNDLLISLTYIASLLCIFIFYLKRHQWGVNYFLFFLFISFFNVFFILMSKDFFVIKYAIDFWDDCINNIHEIVTLSLSFQSDKFPDTPKNLFFQDNLNDNDRIVYSGFSPNSNNNNNTDNIKDNTQQLEEPVDYKWVFKEKNRAEYEGLFRDNESKDNSVFKKFDDAFCKITASNYVPSRTHSPLKGSAYLLRVCHFLEASAGLRQSILQNKPLIEQTHMTYEFLNSIFLFNASLFSHTADIYIAKFFEVGLYNMWNIWRNPVEDYDRLMTFSLFLTKMPNLENLTFKDRLSLEWNTSILGEFGSYRLGLYCRYLFLNELAEERSGYFTYALGKQYFKLDNDLYVKRAFIERKMIYQITKGEKVKDIIRDNLDLHHIEPTRVRKALINQVFGHKLEAKDVSLLSNNEADYYKKNRIDKRMFLCCETNIKNIRPSDSWRIIESEVWGHGFFLYVNNYLMSITTKEQYLTFMVPDPDSFFKDFTDKEQVRFLVENPHRVDGMIEDGTISKDNLRNNALLFRYLKRNAGDYHNSLRALFNLDTWEQWIRKNLTSRLEKGEPLDEEFEKALVFSHNIMCPGSMKLKATLGEAKYQSILDPLLKKYGWKLGFEKEHWIYDLLKALNLWLNYKILNLDIFTLVCFVILCCFFYGIAYKNYLIENKTLEYGIFLVIAQYCVIFLFSSINLMNLVISFECISFISYVLISYERRNKFSTRSGIQYLILSGIMSSFLFVSFSLWYRTFGTFDITFINLINNIKNDIYSTGLNEIQLSLKYLNLTDFFYYEHISYSLYISVVLFLINLSFKGVIGPFHIWAPTIYGNSPLVSTIFLNTFLKLIYFVTLGSLLYYVYFFFNEIWKPCLIFLSISSILSATFGAISERLSKRFFIYTSMSHVAFILSGYLCSNTLSFFNSTSYLVIYIFSSLIMWFFLLLYPRKLIYIVDFKIFKVNKILSYIFIVFMFSMSGLPPLGGFFIKYNILANLFSESFWLLGFILLLFTVISFFYYLKIIKIVFFEQKLNFNFFYMELSQIKWKKILLMNIFSWLILLYMLFFHSSFLWAGESSLFIENR